MIGVTIWNGVMEYWSNGGNSAFSFIGVPIRN